MDGYGELKNELSPFILSGPVSFIPAQTEMSVEKEGNGEDKPRNNGDRKVVINMKLFLEKFHRRRGKDADRSPEIKNGRHAGDQEKKRAAGITGGEKRDDAFP